MSDLLTYVSSEENRYKQEKLNNVLKSLDDFVSCTTNDKTCQDFGIIDYCGALTLGQKIQGSKRPKSSGFPVFTSDNIYVGELDANGTLTVSNVCQACSRSSLFPQPSAEATYCTCSDYTPIEKCCYERQIYCCCSLCNISKNCQGCTVITDCYDIKNLYYCTTNVLCECPDKYLCITSAFCPACNCRVTASSYFCVNCSDNGIYLATSICGNTFSQQIGLLNLANCKIDWDCGINNAQFVCRCFNVINLECKEPNWQIWLCNCLTCHIENSITYKDAENSVSCIDYRYV